LSLPDSDCDAGNLVSTMSQSAGNPDRAACIDLKTEHEYAINTPGRKNHFIVFP